MVIMPAVGIRQRPSGSAFIALLIGFGLLAIAALPSTLLGVLAVPMGMDVGFDAPGLGLAIAVFWAATSVTAPFGGMLADHWNWMRTSIVGSLTSGTALAFTALATSNYATLVAAMVIAGIGLGISSPTSNLVLLKEVPGEYLGQAFGIKQSATPAVSVIAGLSVPAAAAFGWRSVYLAPLLLVPALYLAIWRLTALRHKLSSTAIKPQERRNHHRTKSISLTWTTPVTVLGTLVLTTLAGFSVVTMVNSGISLASSGIVFAAASGLALMIRVGAGWWLDRRAQLDLAPVSILFAGSVLGILLMATGSTPMVVIGVVIAMTCSLGWPPVLILLVVQSNPQAPARSSGINAIGSGIGSIIGPMLFGLAVPAVGYGYAWLLIAAAAGIATIVCVAAQRHSTKHHAVSQEK